jgi:hypothetical protein
MEKCKTLDKRPCWLPPVCVVVGEMLNGDVSNFRERAK